MEINKNENLNESLKFFLNEANTHKKIVHPNVVTLHNVEVNDYKFFMILEYCSKGSLHNYLKTKKMITLNEIKSLFLKICLGLHHLHSKRIIHRDLKLENILLSETDEPKLSDFGWASSLKKQNKRLTFCGTYEYMAPEIFESEQYDYKVDIWALGILLFEMIHSFTPFLGSTAFIIYKNILNQEISFKEGLNNVTKNLITSILKIKPEERLSLKDILDHPFFFTDHSEEYLDFLHVLKNQQSFFIFKKQNKTPESVSEKNSDNLDNDLIQDYQEESKKSLNQQLKTDHNQNDSFCIKNQSLENHEKLLQKKDEETSFYNLNKIKGFFEKNQNIQSNENLEKDESIIAKELKLQQKKKKVKKKSILKEKKDKKKIKDSIQNSVKSSKRKMKDELLSQNSKEKKGEKANKLIENFTQRERSINLDLDEIAPIYPLEKKVKLKKILSSTLKSKKDLKEECHNYKSNNNSFANFEKINLFKSNKITNNNSDSKKMTKTNKKTLLRKLHLKDQSNSKSKLIKINDFSKSFFLKIINNSHKSKNGDFPFCEIKEEIKKRKILNSTIIFQKDVNERKNSEIHNKNILESRIITKRKKTLSLKNIKRKSLKRNSRKLKKKNEEKKNFKSNKISSNVTKTNSILNYNSIFKGVNFSDHESLKWSKIKSRKKMS